LCKGYWLNKTQLQEKEGIDAVIVDSVLSIRQGLQAPDEAKFNEINATGLPIHPPPIPVIKEDNEGLPVVQLNGHPQAV
jgi:glycerophosphodiester phosphodiesterase